MKVLIDNGHGWDTNGKRSPDGQFLEWCFAREIATSVVMKLLGFGVNATLLVPEHYDVSLAERVRRVNEIYEPGHENAMLVSIHANAAGNGEKWMTGRGWECYTSPGNTMSDAIAEEFYNQAKMIFQNQKIREDYTDGDADKEASFYILKQTKCPAILTENFFYDNKQDLDYMMSVKGKMDIVNVHVRAIVEFLNRDLPF